MARATAAPPSSSARTKRPISRGVVSTEQATPKFSAHGDGKESFGGSTIVDPWGEVLARAEDGEGFVTADLDLARQDEVRAQLPSLANRMPDAYRWPVEAHA